MSLSLPRSAASLGVALALCCSQSAQAGVTMQVTAASHTVLLKTVSNPPADAEKRMDVTLADDYIAVKTGDLTAIYDFKTRRRIVMDGATRTYVDYSLYDVVGFRAMELENREKISQALAAGKLDVPAVSAAETEHELSVAKSDATKISDASAGGMLEFSADGHKLATWSKQGTKLSAADAAHFAQFVRYTLGGHPQLLARLATGRVAPEQLSFIFNGSFGVRTVSAAISDVKTANPPAYDLKGYAQRQSVAPAPAFDILLDRMAALAPPQLTALEAEHPCDTAADFRADQLLDTLLGRTECVLSTGASMLPFTPEQTAMLRDDTPVGLMLAAHHPGKPAEYPDAVKTLVELRKYTTRKTYILKLLEANNRVRLGQTEEALQLFGEALDANPVLGGAYKDLGDLLMLRYDSARAWRSWDIGRRIAPKLQIFDEVTNYEAELVKRHPEYF